jgi:ABC-type transport system involved in multi-copper enzyme maturation permease subunit
MSSIPPPTSDQVPPADVPAPFYPATPGESAPSAILSDVPTLTRLIGVVGLFLTVLGLVVVATTRLVGPRIVPETLGFVCLCVGLIALLYHSVTDNEQDIRRMYGLAAGCLLVLAVAFGLIPGPFDASVSEKATGFYLLPWGVGTGLLALLFAVPFARHETHQLYRDIALYALLGVGGLLSAGVVVAGVFQPDFLAGPGLALGLLGVGFLCAYMSQVDTSEGTGYLVAFALGAVGGAALFYAFGRTVFPTVLYEGPSVLRNPNQALDRWAVAGRGMVILVFVGVAALGALGKYPVWLRAVLAVVGLVWAGVFVAASLNPQISGQPREFLVPGGLILAFLGAVYLGVALGVCSDNQFVTLTRRELSAYFFSPIGYLVLSGMAACEWLAYWDFYDLLAAYGRQGAGMTEPIVGLYFFDLIPILCMILAVSALTMRLLSEEKRTGTLEVLLTAPVNEWPVVLSKFCATWLFFLVCWLPAGLYLVAIRLEAGAPFDYRPLLSFYLALAVCGAAFIAIGILFSSLTSNQIVAAVLTSVTLLMFLVCFYVKRKTTGVGPTMQAFLTRLSFIDMWQQSLQGQLPLRDVLVWASAAVFSLFLSVKVLEARKWN